MVQFQELDSEGNKIQEIIEEDDRDEQYTDEEGDVEVDAESEGKETSEQPLVLKDNEFDDDEDEEDDQILNESFLERIGALVDIIPPTTRVHIQTTLFKSAQLAFGLGKTFGSGLWMVATASLLVFLPVSLELERDSMAIQESQQMRSSSTN